MCQNALSGFLIKPIELLLNKTFSLIVVDEGRISIKLNGTGSVPHQAECARLVT